MGRRVERTRNNKTWTEARFNSFIKGGLRRMTQRWGPINLVKKEARVARGKYKCACCGEVVPNSYIDEKGKRKSNICVDHIAPIIDPSVGFVSWDSVVERMFVEKEGLQLLCRKCHDKKTSEERRIASDRRKNGK